LVASGSIVVGNDPSEKERILMDKGSDELFSRESTSVPDLPEGPLSDRMRPRSMEEFSGQEHLLGPGRIVRRALESGNPFSMILWGPPGCGKTALARLVARYVSCHWVAFSAVLSGVREIREVLQEAASQWRVHRKRTVLFVDEIHRFNKAQQDGFLPHVESGRIVLIGATTENPSFEVNKALLSRTRVLVLHPLGEEDIRRIVNDALTDRERGLGVSGVRMDPDAMSALCGAVQGDARRALNALELAATLCAGSPKDRIIGIGEVQAALQKKMFLYDKDGEEHYNLISAFIKSMRGSDPDAALYWMVRMLEGGEDPLFIARRMVIFASEDVGNADPGALTLAIAMRDAVRFVGLPEATLNLSQAATYLACAPKSNASCRAYGEARRAVLDHGTLPVPMHLRNAPTGLMKNLGYGKDYRYPHKEPGAFVPEQYLPDLLADIRFYEPTDRGREREIRDRLTRWRSLKRERGKKKGPTPT
jgi:putative ATPase